MKKNDGERRGWTLAGILLLIGFLLVILAGNLAIRFTHGWTLKADMGSSLNPDTEYLLSGPRSIVPALIPAILTQPVWINVFLTAGAEAPTRIPVLETQAPQATPTLVPPTNAPASLTVTPTNTALLFTPTKLATSQPTLTKTSTSTTTAGLLPPTSTRTATATLVSTITRTPTTTVTFTATRTPTQTSTSTATRTPTASATATSTATVTSTPTSTATATQTAQPEADLQITINDGAAYYAGGIFVQYTVVVSNPAGPAGALGAGVTTALSSNLTNIAWSCTGWGGASCTSAGAGNLADTVNLPAGTSVTYLVNAQVVGSPSGNLLSTASVTAPPAITDTNLLNNSSTDMNTLIYADPPPGQIGPNPDGNPYNLSAGSRLTLPINITVNGHGGYDMVYYEFPMGSGIWLDWVTVEISDGRNWYTVFNWGDNVADGNTNMDFNILSYPVMPPFPPPEEPDQRDIPSAELYNSTGIAINLDGIVPQGDYLYVRFSCPSSIGGLPDTDGKMEIDAIAVLP